METSVKENLQIGVFFAALPPLAKRLSTIAMSSSVLRFLALSLALFLSLPLSLLSREQDLCHVPELMFLLQVVPDNVSVSF